MVRNPVFRVLNSSPPSHLLFPEVVTSKFHAEMQGLNANQEIIIRLLSNRSLKLSCSTQVGTGLSFSNISPGKGAPIKTKPGNGYLTLDPKLKLDLRAKFHNTVSG